MIKNLIRFILNELIKNIKSKPKYFLNKKRN